MKKIYNIAVVGLGQVGIYLLNELNTKKKDIEHKTGKKINIVAVSARSISKKRRLKYLVALVLRSNVNSFNFFSSMGFIKYKTDLEFYDLRLNIEKNNE